MYNKTDHWQQYIGSVWASVLSGHSLDRSGTIIEIGPGFTDKIGRGLAMLQFSGKLYVVEPNEVALEWVTQRYQSLLPYAMIVAVNRSIQEAHTVLPVSVEAILMNHVLDDMVLHAALQPAEQQSIFSQIKPGESCLSQVKHTWQGLLGNPPYLSMLKHEVLAGLCKLVDDTNARIVGMSQYKGWFLLQNELQDADLVGNTLLLEMASLLADMKAKDKDILRSYDQDPQDWLVIERENVLTNPAHKTRLVQRLQQLKAYS